MSLTEIPRQAVDTVQSGRNYLDSLANKYIVKPKDAIGIGGFVFDYEGDTNVTIQADITDHYAENNQFLNDHYALKPIRLTLKGYVGELVLQKPAGVLGALSSLQNKLTAVQAYIGKYTPQALGKIQKALTKAQSTVNKFDNALARTKNIVGFFSKSSPAQTKQAQAYLFLESLMLSKQIFMVQTPYKFFPLMAIESLSMTQDETTKFVSDITITVKEMRFADTLLTTENANAFAGRTRFQSGTQADQGLTKGQPQLVSSLDGLLAGGK